ncbi:hypothetical protein Egran_05838 [Elaphomyces granulatus]|uniref:Uncharacterized protein n=1 Tax=Elaphomyces granulatus TaxID=519963 RepID=A0A232LQM1_9EURO|nr:hypothetical protein Egran_05838 [Elaphomyces granulatus]
MMTTSYRIFNFCIFCSLFSSFSFLHLTALAAAEIESETVNYNPNPFLLTSPHDPTSILTRSNGESETENGITINYATVEGYFLQDLASTDSSSLDYTAHNFGLINQSYSNTDDSSAATPWERFYKEVVVRLNQDSPAKIQYKVLFLGRHGEGWHNAAESFYGTPAWNVSCFCVSFCLPWYSFPLACLGFILRTTYPKLAKGQVLPYCYWAELNGNETASWADARLTSLGITQAQTAHTFWQSELTAQNIHPPDSYFVSPLFRALMTAKITFDGLRFPPGAAPFQPLILEVFRETISIHTCDRRSSRTEIHDAFPSWQIESSFTECDELWNGVTAETGAAEEVRAKRALDRVFASRRDRGLFISITSHSGEIAALLQVLGHRPFDLNTGAVIPVLVKAETISVEPTETTAPQWTTSAHCISPPVTSVSTGCLCASSAAPVTTPLVAPNMCS